MLTELDLTTAAGVTEQEEELIPSHIQTYADYPMDHAEFEYSESHIGDSYYDLSQATPVSHFGADQLAEDLYDTQSATSVDVRSQSVMSPFGGTHVCEVSGLSYEKEALSVYGDSLTNYEVMESDAFRGCLDFQQTPGPFDCSSDEPSTETPATEEKAFSRPQSKPTTEGNGKVKITSLQRQALDAIFAVTDKPSRNLLLHIASELDLHHITVKNFFSNGRRRLRRAAAKLSDPERCKRESLKRKEKKRLASLAAAAACRKQNSPTSKVSLSFDHSPEQMSNREPAPLSPERRALMVKLADKVQRSVAQKGLNAVLNDLPCNQLHDDGNYSSWQQPTLSPEPFLQSNAEFPYTDVPWGLGLST